jgi:hypothetical protein
MLAPQLGHKGGIVASTIGNPLLAENADGRGRSPGTEPLKNAFRKLPRGRTTGTKLVPQWRQATSVAATAPAHFVQMRSSTLTPLVSWTHGALNVLPVIVDLEQPISVR